MPSDLNKISFIEQIHNFVRTKAQDHWQNTGKALPGHITKILQNDFVEFTFDANGPWTLPKVQIPQAFSKYHREPTAVGDKGYAVPGDIFIGGESGQDGSTATMYPRGNLSTLTFHPISNKSWPTKDPNMFLVTGGSSGHTIQSADGKTSTVIDSQNNINHTSSAAITSKATNTNTIASSNQSINIVPSQSGNVTVGASSNPNANPPIPSLQTIMNVIGSVMASGMMGAAGGMAGAGSSGGPPAGSTPPAGGVGEVISSVVTTGINLVSSTATNIASITLTPGNWTIFGEIWYAPTGSLAAVAHALTLASATFPGTPQINTARGQLVATIGNPFIGPLGPCIANVTVNTTYWLIGYAAITSGTCTATGKIWARRSA